MRRPDVPLPRTAVAASVRRFAVVSTAAVGLMTMTVISPAEAAAPNTIHAVAQTGTIVGSVPTDEYGSVLIGGGKAGVAPLAGYPLYEISSDYEGKFGCTTKHATGFDFDQGDMTLETCTGPESDELNSVQSDEWPALTTTGPPVAGPGVNQKLLGSVLRPGIGRQVTYAGHPLYLFDQPSSPLVPQGEGFLETVYPMPPWHGLWDAVAASTGAPAPGQAIIETETLPDGKTAVAAGEYPNAALAAISVYSYSRDSASHSACNGTCATVWIPVLTSSPPLVVGLAARDVGVISRPDGTKQVTYDGKPLYLYSQEKAILGPGGGGPQSTGTAGNGNGLAGPSGGVFSLVFPVS